MRIKIIPDKDTQESCFRLQPLEHSRAVGQSRLPGRKFEASLLRPREDGHSCEHLYCQQSSDRANALPDAENDP